MGMKNLPMATVAAISLTACFTNVVITLGSASMAATQSFDEIYVFGDSLSNVGNVFKTTKGENPQSPPYFRGHYSNGPIWVEYLASELRLTTNQKTNFAFGGATTGDSREIPPGLLTQIERFKATHLSADPKALYIIWAGANDYLRGANDYTLPINNLTKAVKLLLASGDKNILVVNLPDLGKLPGTRTIERSHALDDLTHKHNSELAASINGLHQQLSSDINIRYLDVNSLFNQIINNPHKFGFKNVTRPCLSKYSICKNSNEYLFWDNIHPTTATHKLLMELAFSILKSAPKPLPVSAAKPSIILDALVFCALGTGLILGYKKYKDVGDRST